MEPQSVEAVCNLLSRSRLLTAEQVRALYQRWRAEAKSADDVAAFGQWLVAREYLTEFQAGLVMRGKVDHLFFGPYKILERIGKGRMAGVYSAVHALGQPVAIKVLPPSRAKVPELLARFQREARLAMKLKHPNVVRTFQTGENDGLHYIVMEYLDGETLEDVLKRRGKLPPAEAVRVAHQALLALQHLHEHGMIHRDIKPGNLMLLGGTAASALSATAKLMDIGLGKALFDEGAPASPGGRFELTNEGSLLGTPDYMAPEQARNATNTDIRADIYSLGCTLYHALGGQVPFPETNLVRQLMRHASEAPRPLRELSPAVPESLQQIVEWMMAKDPAQRYPTPERAAQALQVFLTAGSPAATVPEGRMRAYLDWLDKQPGAAAAVPTAAPAPAPIPEIELVPVEVRPKRAARKGRPVPAAPPRKKKSGPREDELDEVLPAPRTLSRRDLMLIGIGGGVVVGGALLVGALAWGLHHLLRPKADESPPTEPAAPPPTEPE
jgi:tRNA A-37 threonylcarbamoyl transferase component Bud32